MWGWLQPQCPLGTEEKVWVETRLTWLSQQLGRDRMLKARVVEPTDEFFPGKYSGTPDDAQRIFRHLAGYMQIDPAPLKLVVRSEWTDDSPLGQYQAGERAIVFLNPSQLADPESLVGTLAHELAHHILLGGGLLQENNEDLERLTDLLPAFLGLGIFGANSAFRERNMREGRSSWWSMHKQGYLPMRMHAYGLAVFAWARGESRPAWTRHLRPDISVPLRAGLRFLIKMGDCTFSPAAASGGDLPVVADCQRRLQNASASQRFVALLDLLEHVPAAAPTIECLTAILRDRDGDVACLAARVLGVIGPAASSSVPELHAALVGRVQPLRVRAAYALADIGTSDPSIVNDIVRALEDDSRELAAAAAYAVGRCAARNEAVARRLLPLYETALIKCDYDLIDKVAVALWSTSPDAQRQVREHFAEADADLRSLADECLSEARKSLAEEAREQTSDVADDDPTPV